MPLIVLFSPFLWFFWLCQSLRYCLLECDDASLCFMFFLSIYDVMSYKLYILICKLCLEYKNWCTGCLLLLLVYYMFSLQTIKNEIWCWSRLCKWTRGGICIHNWMQLCTGISWVSIWFSTCTKLACFCPNQSHIAMERNRLCPCKGPEKYINRYLETCWLYFAPSQYKKEDQITFLYRLDKATSKTKNHKNF